MASTGSVTFTYGMFLHDAANLADYIVGRRLDPDFSFQPRGTLRITAAGKRRWASRPGRGESFTIATRFNQSTDRVWLEERDDAEVLYRDKVGRVLYVVISDLSIGDAIGGWWAVAMTMQVVDREHAVLEVPA